jgi:hypothetical protein
VADSNPSSAAIRVALPLGINPDPDGCELRKLTMAAFCGEPLPPVAPRWKMPLTPPSTDYRSKAQTLCAAPGALQIRADGGFDWVQSNRHCPAVLNEIIRSTPLPSFPRRILVGAFPPSTLNIAALPLIRAVRIALKLESRGTRLVTSIKGLSLEKFPPVDGRTGLKTSSGSVRPLTLRCVWNCNHNSRRR